MIETLTPAEEARIRARHVEEKSWPSQRNDPTAQDDGYVHYCKWCLGRTWPCEVVRLLASLDEARR